MFEVKRGNVYYAELPDIAPNIQNGLRPVLVIQNDLGNKYAPTVIIVPLTTCIKKEYLITHVHIPVSSGLPNNSLALCEQILTINKNQLKEYITTITDKNILRNLKYALGCSIGLVKLDK